MVIGMSLWPSSRSPQTGPRSLALGDRENEPSRSAAGYAEASLLETLFNELPDVVFFVKDEAGRYTSVNNTLMVRCGFQKREMILGLTAEQAYPKPLGAAYSAQDQLVLQHGSEIRNKLELHLYPGGGQGWCLTFKKPLYDASGKVTGLLGLSRDLHRPNEDDADYRRLARAVDDLQRRYSETVRLEAL